MSNRLKTCLVFAVAMLCQARLGAQTYLVNGPGKLTSITNLIKTSPPGGSRHIRFQTYQDVGTFSVNGLNVDSLIFERDEPSAEVLDVPGTLIDIKGATGPVVVRNIAVKLSAGTSIFIDGLGAASNKNLLIDSCIVFSDTVGTTFLSWGSKSGSNGKIEIRRSIISLGKGNEGRADLSADSISISNNYFNLSGLMATTTGTKLSFLNNTTNRVQFRFSGDGTGSYEFSNNLFGHPPLVPKFNGPQKYVANIFGFPNPGTATGNKRFSTWTNFDNSATPIFTTGENLSGPAFGDSLAPWDFKEPGDATRGYQNPASALYPAYNTFPGDTAYKFRGGSDSIFVNIASAAIPRMLSGSLTTISYPSSLDSTRTYWSKDTVVSLTGPAFVKSISIPQGKSFGQPVLYSQNAGTFQPGTPGKDGDLAFQNGLPAAKVFLPTFIGQNTPKGSQVLVRGLSIDTVLRFTTVTRTGKTRILNTSFSVTKKRFRLFQNGAQFLGMRDSTSAEGSGTLRFGLSKAGVPGPLLSDSLSWILPGDTFLPVLDSAGKYWGDLPFAASSQALLVERLALGAGRDTMPIAQGRVVFAGATGIQAKVDSSFSLPTSQLADMAAFSKPLTVTWKGRQTGDSLSLEWKKNQAQQKIFALKDGKAIGLTPTKEDSNQVFLSYGIADSAQVVFLARKYSISAGVKTTIAIGSDTARDLLSSKPGELSLDTNVSLTGLPTDSLRILAKRQATIENLQITGTYTQVLKGLLPNREINLRAFVRRAARWDSIPVVRSGSYYRLTASQDDGIFVVAEIIKSSDTLPVVPASDPTVAAKNGTLTIRPVLTPAETARLSSYQVEIYSLDVNGHAHIDTVRGLSGDSAFTLPLESGKFYVIRVGYESYSGKITWKALPAIPQDARALLAAAAAASKPYQAAVWELASLPWDGNAKEDIRNGFSGTDSKSVHIEEWTGSWSPLADAAPLKKGKGYLIGVPREYKPTIPSSFSFTLAPESIALDTGWQLVASPYPFSYPESAIQKDEAAVGLFYALTWVGTGDTAKPVWTVSDTLKPFHAYALHSKAKGELRFEPGTLAAKRAAKRSALGGRIEIKFSSFEDEARSQLYLMPQSQSRPTPALPFFATGLSSHWGFAEGPSTWAGTNGTGINQIAVLRAPAAARLGVSLAEGNRSLAIWDPRIEKLQLLSPSTSVAVEKGENWFRILEVDPDKLEEARADLIHQEGNVFELLPNYPNPFSARTTLAFSIPMTAGTQSSVRLQVIGLSGRVHMEKDFRNVTPGKLLIPLDGSAWSPGEYVVRATFTGQGKPRVFQRRIVHLGGVQ